MNKNATTLIRVTTMLVALAAAMHCGAAEETVTYTYDTAGRLVTAVYGAGSTNAAFHYQYDANGNITNQLSLAANDNGPDSDADSLGDLFELVYFGDLGQNGAGDPDGDSLVNSNEFALGGNPTVTNTDGDAHSDYAEYIAGTALDNPQSWFGLDGSPVSNANARLWWNAVAGRTYQLQVSSDLMDGDGWTNRGSEQASTSNAVMQSSQPLETLEYYRVNVKLTP